MQPTELTATEQHRGGVKKNKLEMFMVLRPFKVTLDKAIK